jgi:hypothetical protein
MEVKDGWATDFGKVRFDVLIQEVDVARMLSARGAEDPAGILAQMSTGDVFEIMSAEAKAFVHVSLAKQEPGQREQHLAKVKEYRAARNQLLDKYAPKKPAGG